MAQVNPAKNGNRTLLTRRRFLARTSSAAGITLLTGCCPSAISVNFLVNVEDSSGAVLGTGVWRWNEHERYQQYCWVAGWEGEAIQIKLSDGRVGYLLKYLHGDRRSFGGSAIFGAFRDAGFVNDIKQKNNPGYGGMGPERMKAVKYSMGRITLPDDISPVVLAFSDPRNPSTAEAIKIGQGSRLSNAINARISLQPTNRTVTTGIEKNLPWVAHLKPREAIPGFEDRFSRLELKSSWKDL